MTSSFYETLTSGGILCYHDLFCRISVIFSYYMSFYSGWVLHSYTFSIFCSSPMKRRVRQMKTLVNIVAAEFEWFNYLQSHCSQYWFYGQSNYP